MKITVESTSEVVLLVVTKDGKRTSTEIPARIWEGETGSGVKVTCLIASIGVKDGQDVSQFERELIETKPPSTDSLPWPARLIL
jgi:hypothetical protein